MPGHFPSLGPGCGLGAGESAGQRARGRGPWAALPVGPKTVTKMNQFSFFLFPYFLEID